MVGTTRQPLLGNYEFQVTWSMADMFGYGLLWLLLILITFGLASFFAPYAWAAKLLNGCEVRDRSGNRLGVLQVDVRIADQLVHILLWMLLTFITFGLAGIFYYLGVARTILNNTYIV